MDETLLLIVIALGSLALGLGMLWLLGLLFEQAVRATNRVAAGFMVLVVVALVAGYGRLLTYVLLTYL